MSSLTSRINWGSGSQVECWSVSLNTPRESGAGLFLHLPIASCLCARKALHSFSLAGYPRSACCVVKTERFIEICAKFSKHLLFTILIMVHVKCTLGASFISSTCLCYDRNDFEHIE